MKKVNVPKLFFSYLKEHYKGILLYDLLAATFALVFYLYNLPVEAVLYGAALASFSALIAILIDFTNYYKRHIMMRKLLDKITLNSYTLPKPRNLTEESYTALIERIQEDKNQVLFQNDKAKTEMVDYYTMWAHQIKTPISAMALLLQTENSDLSAEMAEELFKIEQYVEMVLSYLRLNGSTTDFVIKENDLDHIVKDAVHKYAKQFVRRKISLNYQPLNQVVLTDEKWLSFVIEQLLSNALKYTQRGSVSIYMAKDAKCTLVIEDTGIGIAPEDLPRVFERGFTGYNGRRDKKSTGIGLYLCRQTLTKLSHSIRIESETGAGTRVLIDLSQMPLQVE